MEQHKVGDKVPGKAPPHGGSWQYDPEKDELTLIEAPTSEKSPEPEPPPTEPPNESPVPPPKAEEKE